MLGAARPNSVARIGPSRSSLVRAAAGLAGAEVAEAVVGAGDDGKVAALRSFTRRSSPPEGSGAALGRSVLLEAGRLRKSPTLR
jgi:hypothetical protein